MIKTRVQLSLCFALCTTIFACGPRGSASDPLPLAPKPGEGKITDYPSSTPLAPTTTATPATTTPSNPNTPTSTSTPNTPATTPTTPGLTNTPTTEIPTSLATPGGDFKAQIATLPAFGTASTLEVGAWNIENYPKTDFSKPMVAEVLNKLDVDVMGVEEIRDTEVFNDLLKEMPNFSGVLAVNGGQKQNVGVIYRTADFKLVSSTELFRGQNGAFPRPPLAVRLDPVKEGQSDIMMIVVHLKAFGDDDSAQRRQEANVILESYTTALLNKEPSLKVVIVGDFNQPLLTEEERLVFQPWYTRSELYTVKSEVNVKYNDYSFFGGQRFSFIDHIIASNNFSMEVPVVPKLQTTVSDFETHASDHLPILAKIP